MGIKVGIISSYSSSSSNNSRFRYVIVWLEGYNVIVCVLKGDGKYVFID